MGTPKDTSKSVTKIKQVDAPKGGKPGEMKSKGGIPTSKYAGDIADEVKAPSFKTGKTGEPGKVAVGKDTVKTKRPAEAVKEAADRADKIVAGMGRGMKSKDGKSGEPGKVGYKSDKVTDRAPTAVARDKVTGKTGTVTAKAPAQKTAPQVKFDAKKLPCPSDAPKKATWVTEAAKAPFYESVELVVKGNVKSSFGVINREVASKLVEGYKQHGIEASLRKAQTPAAWKADKELQKLMFEALDAEYNSAESFASSASRKARNRFFSLVQEDYSPLYESKQAFTDTALAAFDKVMEAADASYRKTLKVYDGIVRVLHEGEVIDLGLVSQARNTDMALRNMRDTVMEEYGVEVEIKHVFIDGDKYLPTQIKPWKSRLA